MRIVGRTGLTVVVGAALALLTLPAAADDGVIGAVYTATNDPTGNAILQYDRLADGSLLYVADYDTGGLGTGAGLGNQGGVVLSDNGRWLLVVNAGSNDLSVFAIGEHGLTLADTEYAGGIRPVSVAIHGDLVYVVNAGDDTLAGLRLDNHGQLDLLPGSSTTLSGTGTAPAQIGFSPNGEFIVVTEKATDVIAVFPLDGDGYTGPGVFNHSEGPTPFSFDFGKREQLFISEVGGGAGGGAVSAYRLLDDGTLATLAASVPNFETAPCWLVVTRDGHRAFTTNTPDDSLSAYVIGFDGGLRLVDPDGRTGEPGVGTRPLDMDLSDDGRHLYTLNTGNGTVSTFRIGPDGSLSETATVGGVPSGVNGLAAR